MAASIERLSKTLEIFDSLTNKPDKFLSIQNTSWKKLKTLTKIFLILICEDDDVSVEDDAGEDDGENSSSDDSNVDNEIENIKTRLKAARRNDDLDSASDLDFDFPTMGEDIDEDRDDEAKEDEEVSLFKDDNTSSGNSNTVSENAKNKVGTAGKKSRKTEVDDKFFKLSEMETFLEDEDAKEFKRIKREERGSKPDEEESDDEEDIDMFGALSSDESDDQNGDEKDGSKRGLHYQDFFDPPSDISPEKPSRKKVRFSDMKVPPGVEDSNEEDGVLEDEEEGVYDDDGEDGGSMSDSDSEGEELADILGGRNKTKKEIKSKFEERQEKLKTKIKSMENSALEDKPWQLAGEIAASARPENSLLEEHLQFEHTTRLAPVITEDTTRTLEDLIKQRVKDKVWDDVERKEKPKEDPYEYKKRIVLDQEKSKQSLAEIYEQEYLKLQQVKDRRKKDPRHDEIKAEHNVPKLNAAVKFPLHPNRPYQKSRSYPTCHQKLWKKLPRRRKWEGQISSKSSSASCKMRVTTQLKSRKTERERRRGEKLSSKKLKL
ncbi:hypothetical protein ScPMuIL_018766 [Solemya velum]